MSTNIVYTASGTDFTSVRIAILVDNQGKNSGVQVVSTQNGNDFTSIFPAVVVDTNGNPI